MEVINQLIYNIDNREANERLAEIQKMERKLQRAKEELERTMGKSKRPVTSVEEEEAPPVVDLTGGLNLLQLVPDKTVRPERKILKASREFVLAGMVGGALPQERKKTTACDGDSESEWIDDDDDA